MKYPLMGHDQYGNHYAIGMNPPRKWLAEHFGVKHIDKMYRDPDAKEWGYIVAGNWIELYQVVPWKEKLP